MCSCDITLYVPQVSASCLVALLLTFVTSVLSDLKLMHPVAGGGMVVGDVSIDTPDYHYLAASPFGGVIAAGGLGALPPVMTAPAPVVSRFPMAGGVRSYSRMGPMRRSTETEMVWHTARSLGVAKTIMQGTVNGGRRRGRQKKRWEDNIREWTGLELRNTLRIAEVRGEWKAMVRRSSAAPRQISHLRDR
ncbi:UDP-glucuronosyltransferase 2A1-like [Elysia marginata]|uniref:UDP-glucuronosyltransferase 2A1-like n=1 Tax=Elysia marginata TaxID=1093978 RepID=A0AAV4FIE8_9GAST|nr:UDP-glucuronosyltransferase 2A1-like [Elysia marginata]